MSPPRQQAFTWTNAVLLSIGLRATNFSEILIEINFPEKNAFEIVVCQTGDHFVHGEMG